MSIFRQRVWKDAEKLAEACASYFSDIDICNEAIMEKGRIRKPYTHAGLAMHLGLSNKKKFEEWRAGLEGEDFKTLIEWCDSKIEEFLVEGSITGEFNSKASDLYLKSNLNYSDKKSDVPMLPHENKSIQLVVVRSPEEAQHLKTLNINDVKDIQEIKPL